MSLPFQASQTSNEAGITTTHKPYTNTAGSSFGSFLSRKEHKAPPFLFKMTERIFAKAIDKIELILYNNKDKNNRKRRL
jgi:hypothetical protein